MSRTCSAAVVLACAVVTAGCGRQESITRYTVPKDGSPTIVTTDPSGTDQPKSQPTTERTAWFFKMQGPAADVDPVEDQFTAVVESIRFESGKPRWSLPQGWSQSAGSQMRFATLTVDGTDPALEVSVIPLPVFGSDVNAYVRQNIDRWRGQVGLPPTSSANWMAQGEAVGELRASLAGEVPVIFVDLVGKTDDADPARMLGAVLLPDFQAPAGSQASNPPMPSRSPPNGNLSLTFEVPQGWEAGKASAMRAASFVVSDGDTQVDISAIAAGGGELDNVNRWRGQIGLDAVTQAELDDAARQIDVDGRAGRMFDLVGKSEAIFAVIVPLEGSSWFFKLMGNPALAEREQANFESFVRSVRFQ